MLSEEDKNIYNWLIGEANYCVSHLVNEDGPEDTRKRDLASAHFYQACASLIVTGGLSRLVRHINEIAHLWCGVDYFKPEDAAREGLRMSKWLIYEANNYTYNHLEEDESVILSVMFYQACANMIEMVGIGFIIEHLNKVAHLWGAGDYFDFDVQYLEIK